MPTKLYQRVGRMLDRREIVRPDTAVIHNINGDRADIRIGNSANIIRFVPVVGDINLLSIGDTVSIRWVQKDGGSNYTPVVLTTNELTGTTTQVYSETEPDGITIEYSPSGLRVVLGSITLSHLDFVPSLVGHIHDDSLNAHGWQIDDSGTIFSQATYIHSDGQISLGLSPDLVKLDAMHPTHRIWAGAINPLDAPFSVSKEGALTSTSGHIGGWLIGSTSLSSDSGNAVINSDTPFISLGATAFQEGNGFWVGKINASYCLFIGDSENDMISWDGTELIISGSLRSNDYVPGAQGWGINSSGDAEFNNVTVRGTLRTTVFEYNEIQATAGTLGIYKNAAITAYAFETPASSESIIIPIAIDSGSIVRFSVGDYVYIRTVINTLVKTLWGNVTAVSNIINESYTITVSMSSGSWSTEFPAGTVITNFGPSGNGFITLSADNSMGNSPNISLWTHSGTTSWTLNTRIGNLRNSYGYPDSDMWGMAVGEYITGNTFITIDPDNGIRIRNKSTPDITFAQWDNNGIIVLGENASDQHRIQISSSAIYMYYGNTSKVYIHSSGNLRIGTDTSTGDGSCFSIFTTEQTWNGEPVNTGDILIGSNSASKANLFWDASDGALKFRSGTNSYIRVNASDGAMCVSAVDGYDYDDKRGYNLTYGTTYLGGLHAYVSSPTVYIKLGAKPLSSHGSIITIDADGGTNQTGLVRLTASSNNDATSASLEIVTSTSGYRYAHIVGGLHVGTTWPGAPWVTTNGYAWIDDHLYVGSRVMIGNTSNTKMTNGLTIDQSGADNEIFALKSTGDVTHGCITYADTETYLHIVKGNATAGSPIIRGFGASTSPGITLQGYSASNLTGKTASGRATIEIHGYHITGNTRESLGTDANIFSVRNNGSTKFIVDTEGDVWFTGSLTSYDGSSSYPVYGYHPLSTPVTSSNTNHNWSTRIGDNATIGPISIGTDFSNIPNTAKAVLMTVTIKDSGSGASTTDVYFYIGGNTTYYNNPGIKGNGVTNDAEVCGQVVVPLTSSGQFYWTSGASGTSTLMVQLKVDGYFI